VDFSEGKGVGVIDPFRTRYVFPASFERSERALGSLSVNIIARRYDRTGSSSDLTGDTRVVRLFTIRRSLTERSIRNRLHANVQQPVPTNNRKRATGTRWFKAGCQRPALFIVRSWLRRRFPRYTVQRLALELVRYDVLRHPGSVFQRINATNVFLYRQFSKTEMRCNICETVGAPWYDFPNVRRMREQRLNLVRETLHCRHCGAWMRQRIMAHGLMKYCAKWFGQEATSIGELAGKCAGIDILDTDEFSAISAKLRVNRSYVVSTYAPNLPRGALGNGLYNVDLESIPFEPQRFDIIMTSDVMEHVRDFERAQAEIYRCLRPGGAHIFTVPFDVNALATKTLIDTRSPTDIYLDAPQIHGDPRSGGIAAYRICGADMVDRLRSIGFDAEIVRVTEPGSGIFDGLYFVARRPA
jgi:SAM-dependent methyltransferase